MTRHPASRLDDNPSLIRDRSRLEAKLVGFIARHTPKCREVTKILSDSLERPPSLGMRLRLRLHFLICAWCQRYARQLRLLGKFASQLPSHVDSCSSEALPADAKQRIKQALREQPPP